MYMGVCSLEIAASHSQDFLSISISEWKSANSRQYYGIRVKITFAVCMF